jgi:hypothetical protein
MQTPGTPGGGDAPAGQDDYDELQDFGLDDQEPEAPAEPGDEPAEPAEGPAAEDGEPVAPRPSRPGRRERQQAEIRRLSEDNQRLKREFDAFRTQQAAPRPDPAEVARREQQEREQVATLDYSQQIYYWRDKDRREFQQTLQQQQLGISQQIDKYSWDALANVDPVRAQYADRVEEAFNAEVRAGRMPPSRDIIFKYLYGDEADRLRRQRSDGQRQAAARRVASQTTRPGGLRSDGGAPTRQPAGDSYEASLARLRGKPLW